MEALKLYNKLISYPFGRRIFTYLFCRRLPYFFSIKPLVLDLQEGTATVRMKERRSIHNHIPTIHAIALCNLCEVAVALTTTVTIPDHLRFIPAGMTVKYKKPARGIVRAIARVKKEDFKVGETDIFADVFDEKNENVMSAVITMNVKEKKG